VAAANTPSADIVDTRGLDDLLDESLAAAALDGLPPDARGETVDMEQLSRVALGTAENTRRIYRKRIALFATWCTARGLRAVPVHVEVLRLYLGWLAAKKHSWSTIKVSHAAIVATHRVLGYEVPNSERLRAAVRELRRGITSRVSPVEAISLATLKKIVASGSRDVGTTRDRSLILLTYFGGLLPSESAAVNLESVQRTTDGYLLYLPVRKGAQKGKDAPLELFMQPDPDLCPVRALDAWIVQRAEYARAPSLSPARGALFVALRGGRGYPVLLGRRISRKNVQRVLKRHARAAGVDPATVSVQGLCVSACTTVPSRSSGCWTPIARSEA
jgi:site-specific recombinase XerD